MPGNCTFLVDTYDTLDGVRHAIEVGRELRARGHALAGIRLDSGDLAHLSIEARQLLDDGGLPRREDRRVERSRRDADHQPASSRARRSTCGASARKLVTVLRSARARRRVQARRDPRRPTAAWRDVIKLSEQPIKISNPGILAGAPAASRRRARRRRHLRHRARPGRADRAARHRRPDAAAAIAADCDAPKICSCRARCAARRVRPAATLDEARAPRRRRSRGAVAAHEALPEPAAVSGRARRARPRAASSQLIARGAGAR